jgi:prephenate dehydratase/prephenate dehydrogenase
MTTKKPLIGIIGGTSQFGQWFKFFFENNGCDCLVAGRNTKLTPSKLARQADIVIVSVPIRETVKVIQQVRALVKPGALLCDFTSMKSESLAEMMKTDKIGVLGIHPLFGPLVPSLAGQNIVFCHGRDNHWVNFLKKIFEDRGGKVIHVSAAEHDRQMAMTQALTHFINITFAGVMRKQKTQPYNDFSTPVFRLQSMLAARILGANPSLYADIEIRNKLFREILKEFLSEAQKISGFVLNKNEEAFENEFKKIASSMENFIPIAQTKLSEVLYLIDKQPVEIKKDIGRALGSGTRAERVACLGPEGTFSHAAAKEIFPHEKKFIFTPTIGKIFKALQGNEAKYGVVPIENSITGIVQETLDSILDYPLKVIGSRTLAIHHQLLGRTKNLTDIKIVRSKIQPLGQCREWLANNLPAATLEPQDSSTKAIMATTDPSIAFIGSKEAAKEYNLNIIASNIEDGKHNETQFYVIAKGDHKALSRKLGASKSLIILAVYDRPGVLRDILSIFADAKLNLTKLHSRRTVVAGWDYYFFLEIDAPPTSENFKRAIRKVKNFCSVVRIFGTA